MDEQEFDESVTKPAGRLYEDDSYAWTQAQAELLRGGRLDRADIVNILEEIETLGRTEVAELRSRRKVLIYHLEEIVQPEKASRSWAATIVNQRQELVQHMIANPSLKPRTGDIFAEAYADVRKLAAAQTGLALARFPSRPPFSYARAMDETYWPGRALQDRG